MARTFQQITQSMVRYITGAQKQITDFNPGSVIRTLVEATAAECERLSLALDTSVDAAVSGSSYLAFGFQRNPATAAAGSVVVTGTPPISDTLIAAGKSFMIPNTTKAYVSTAPVTWLAGATSVTLPVSCTVAGSFGNALPNQITQAMSSIAGLTSVTNPLPLTSGRDAETDVARQQRFAAYIRALGRATPNAIAYAATLAQVLDGSGNVIEYVVRTQRNETVPGRVTLFIDNGSSGASGTLVTNCQKVMDGYTDLGTGQVIAGYKAAGIAVRVRAATPQALTVTAALALSPGVALLDVTDAVTQAIQAFFAELEIGQAFDPSAFSAAIQRVSGILGVTLSAPVAQVAQTGIIYTLSGSPALSAL